MADAAAFPLAHQTLGEDVAAAVVLRSGATTSELELRRFAASRLAAFKVPRRIVFVDALPRTLTGKPQRAVLADQFSRGVNKSIQPRLHTDGQRYYKAVISVHLWPKTPFHRS